MVLLGIVVTPAVGIRRPTQLEGVESEGCGVGSVGVGLHDVPSENAEYDAVVGPRTDPPQGADGAPGSSVWQRARDIVAYGPRSFAVDVAVLLRFHQPLLGEYQPMAQESQSSALIVSSSGDSPGQLREPGSQAFARQETARCDAPVFADVSRTLAAELTPGHRRAPYRAYEEVYWYGVMPAGHGVGFGCVGWHRTFIRARAWPGGPARRTRTGRAGSGSARSRCWPRSSRQDARSRPRSDDERQCRAPGR